MSPPCGLFDLLFHPIRTVFYVLFICGLASLISSHWITLSGTSVKDVAIQLHGQKLSIKGYREPVKCLRKYIPICAQAGAFVLAGLPIFADIFGEAGSGTGILLAVTIIFQYYEIYGQEVQASGGRNLMADLQKQA